MAIAYIDAQVHIHAQTWYAARPTEPSGGLSLRVEQVESLSQMTLESLMDAILRTAPQRGDIIICCHAVNQTLAIRLLEGPRRALVWR